MTSWFLPNMKRRGFVKHCIFQKNKVTLKNTSERSFTTLIMTSMLSNFLKKLKQSLPLQKLFANMLLMLLSLQYSLSNFRLWPKFHWNSSTLLLILMIKKLLKKEEYSLRKNYFTETLILRLTTLNKDLNTNRVLCSQELTSMQGILPNKS